MGTVVEIGQGRLEGRERDGVQLFAGIPFAAPPVGALRFAPAQPHEGWKGVRDATEFGRVAMQTAGSLEALAGGGDPDWSEDCLFLNVATPACDDGARPVMVWIHGGGFTSGGGSIPWYDGARLATAGDVVVVSINYRLGALGWLHLGHLDADLASSANAGLTDQVAALRWVAEHIASFGGDPGNVTIFGESAGGMSVATLMGTPSASGLFHKVIAQSGAAHNVVGPEVAQEVAELITAALDVQDVEGLRAVPAERLLEVQTQVAVQIARDRAQRPSGSAGLGLPFSPVVDGVVLPEPPLDAIRRGSAAGVALLAGSTAEEWRLFGLMLRDVEDESTILRRLGRVVEDPEAVAATYRQRGDDVSHDAMWTAIMTDRIFRIPAIRLLEAQAAHQSDATFAYLFEWASTAFGGRLGSCHALEIPFVFDNLDKAGVELFTGPGAPQHLARAMSTAWLRFARTGDPSNELLPPWPAYDEASRATMHLGEVNHLEHDPGAEQRAAWDGIL